jgi:penicillin-binding protein 1A
VVQPKSSVYAPPPHRRSSSVVKRDFHRRLRGKPTRSNSFISLPRAVGQLFGRALSLAVIAVVLAGFLLVGLGGGMLVGYIMTATPVITDQIKTTNETTHIFDAAGNEVDFLTGTSNINRQYISFSVIKSTWIDEAVMAIEDERFPEHIGIDPRRIGSAILSALMNNGSATHGGSTITQQTVKLISGEDSISAQRKIQEWYRAIKLEQQKSKDEIMELYLNLAPMGNSYVGVQSASQAYFGKDAKDLSLCECAFLAGIPNAPSIYNPLTETGKRNALRRMRIVLGKMFDLKMITEQQYNAALNTELVFKGRQANSGSGKIHSYFVEYVIQRVIDDLVSKRGYSPEMASIAVYNSGLRIETTLDSAVQTKVETTFNKQELFFSGDAEELANLPEKPTGSIVVISNTQPGQIKAIVGGFGEKTGNFVYNRAISARRQPGSSIKPLDVYGPSIDTGKITAASIFTDAEMFLNPDTPTKPWPKNSHKEFMGNITVRSALYNSINTVAAYIWANVLQGQTSLSYLKEVGIDRTDESYVAIAIGAFNKGMTTLEMAGAYSTFPNGGYFYEPYAYTRVLDAEGKVLLENTPVYKEVYKPETAFIITNILQDVLTKGTAAGTAARNVLKTGMAYAGKTGTTDENNDKWFCGFSPYYTAAVWYGYDNRLGSTKIPEGDRSNAINIWCDAMSSIHDGLEKKSFDMPASVVKMSVCTDSGMFAGPYCPPEKVITEYFVPSAIMNPSPDEPCTFHAAAPTPTPTIPPTPVPTEPTSSETVPPAG